MIETEIKAIALAILMSIAPELDADELRPDRPLRGQIDLDSMDWLNFLLGLHEKLQVDIPEGDYVKLITLNDILTYLAAKLAAKS